eukprot:CAMPEP_0175667260 /NCGR_PEP_ID=MMETSP0097-20121207/18010_1 /TAXON_ID=311494 /ORGANISM="Alexandrium monilatum, Strain CCMP3105" /LENGTH=48 /DNA_ID= /DNA_START= /DNA_END= /DNA_ORIENTATION=
MRARIDECAHMDAGTMTPHFPAPGIPMHCPKSGNGTALVAGMAGREER